MTPRRRLASAAGLLAVGLLALPALPATSATDPPPAPEEPGSLDGTTAGLDVEITDLAPAVLSPGETLEVSVEVANDSAEDLVAGELQLSMQRYAPSARTQLHQWMDPGRSYITMLLAVEGVGELPAGESTSLTVEVDPANLDLPATFEGWGPRGVEVAVSDTGGTTLADVDRSVTVWYPQMELERTPLSVVVPLSADGAERLEAAGRSPGEDGAGSAISEVAGPRLRELLEAVDRPGVTLAVDGELLAPAEEDEPGSGGAADEPEPGGPGDPGEATGAEDEGADLLPENEDETGVPETGETPPPAEGPQAATLLEALRGFAEADAQEVALLPWADADVAALTHTGATELLAESAEATTRAAAEAGITGELLLWPAAENPDAGTVETGSAAGAGTVLLPVSALPLTEEQTFTPAGRAELEVADPPVPAVLVDDTASAILGGTLPPAPYSGDDATELTALDTRQLLLAETAVMHRERPSVPRAVTLVVPRVDAADGDPAALAAALEVLDAPWVEPASLSEIRALEAPELEREALPEEVVEPGELTAAELASVEHVLATATAYAGVVDDPGLALDPVAAARASLLSAAWREEPGGREELLERAGATVSALAEQLTTVASSSLNLINYSAELPVHVRNDLPADATVQVLLQPSDDRLQTDGPVPLTVPADSQATAQVPVRAIGNGDVRVTIQLLDEDGTPVGTAGEMDVRVRADWETVGTAVVAGVLGVMLVLGLVRTVRRGRRMDPAAAEEAGA